MLWLELGKIIARLGAPLLGAAIAGTPAAPVVGAVCSAIGYVERNENGDVADAPTDPEKLKAAIEADPLAGDKMQQVEAEHTDALKQAADIAAVSVINKLIQ